MQDRKKNKLFDLMVSKISIQSPWFHCVCAPGGTEHHGEGGGASGRATDLMVVRKQRGAQDKARSKDMSPVTYLFHLGPHPTVTRTSHNSVTR